MKTKRRSRYDLTEYSKECLYLRHAREMLGYTRREMSRRTGVSEETIKRWECNGFPKYVAKFRIYERELDSLLGNKKDELVKFIDSIQDTKGTK
jgi:transcriptional regulator with XRE-family HTH domain